MPDISVLNILLHYSNHFCCFSISSIAVGSTVTQKLTLFSDRWTKGRTVTFLNWSDQIPEILLAAYDKSVERVNDPDGLVLLWNTKVQMSAPEYVFQAQVGQCTL